MRIVFVHASFEFDGGALAARPLGGTETALIGVTRALAALGTHEVVVFTLTPRESVHDGVSYRPLGGLGAWARANTADVLVSVRHWMPFWLPLRARLRVYFSPDAHDQPFLHHAAEFHPLVDGVPRSMPLFPPGLFLPGIDHVFCVGRWQAGTFESVLGFPREKTWVTGNAVSPGNFRPLPLEGREPGLLYSSSPHRGLAHLAEWFPGIRARNPGTSLTVCSGLAVYGAATPEGEFGPLFDRLRADGARVLGSVRQAELASLMCGLRVYAYPNTFAETFCISVLEAQAAGMAVVTSRRAALEERIEDGVDGLLIDGEPGTDAYRAAFGDAVDRLLSDPGLWGRLSAGAVRTASLQTYDRLALSWEAFLQESLAGRGGREPAVPAPPSRVEATHPKYPGRSSLLDEATTAHLIRAALARYGG